ncbi:MAG: proton-conducting transporter membrane subunit [Planctomycetota bacterium]
MVLGGGLDLLFFGWELVGLTSALLIAFFHERPKPVEHGLRAFVTYRICDVGLLGALVWLHHTVGSTGFVAGDAPWHGLAAPPDGPHTVAVGLLLLWASMGKSAQVPLGGYCRAMRDRRRRARSSTARSRCTSARSCCCAPARSSPTSRSSPGR